jgi:TPR repeat protein
MLNKPFRWLAFIVLNLFLIDEVLPLLDPWRGTHAQWNATFIVAAVLALPLAAALVRIIRLLRLGSDKGGRDFDWSIEPNLPKLHTAYHLLKSDPEAALRQLKWLADVGSVASMIYVGLFYKRDANPKNPEEAEKWYRRAADAGSFFAYHCLGRLYLEQKRFGEARDAFSCAVGGDYVPSIFYLARMFVLGLGVEKDITTGVALLEKARLRKSVYAGMMLGRIMLREKREFTHKIRGFYLIIVGWIRITAIAFLYGISSSKLY